MALVLDAGPLIALLDRKDPQHDRCLEAIAVVDEDLVVPALTLVEIDYALRKVGAIEAWRTFVGEVDSGAYRLHMPDEPELLRAAELEVTYASLGLGLVDASVIAACETLGETKVATLDHRHFSVVRPRHCDALTLLPA
jgi:predicted nucleic acid-binding protein